MSDQPETPDAVLGMEYNGAEGHEADTVASIVAEMRDTWTDTPPSALLDLADRIEAAAKQEAIDAELKWTRIGYDERKAEEKRAPGNAAAMREALTAFVDSIQWLCDGDERGIFKKQFAPLLSDARAALAAPARNCDRFANGTVAGVAFRAERHDVDEYAFWPSLVNWLFASAEGGDHA